MWWSKKETNSIHETRNKKGTPMLIQMLKSEKIIITINVVMMLAENYFTLR